MKSISGLNRILAGVGIFLILCSMACFTVAYLTSHWSNFKSETTPGATGNCGIIETCRQLPGFSACQSWGDYYDSVPASSQWVITNNYGVVQLSITCFTTAYTDTTVLLLRCLSFLLLSVSVFSLSIHWFFSFFVLYVLMVMNIILFICIGASWYTAWIYFEQHYNICQHLYLAVERVFTSTVLFSCPC